MIKKTPIKTYKSSEDWAKITGRPSLPDRHYYLDTDTGEEFRHISGAVGFPGGIYPGYVLIVGVLRDGKEKLSFKVLEEAEESSFDMLMDICMQLRNKYGYQDYPELFQYFYGDPDRMMSLMMDRNIKHEADIYLSKFEDLEQANRFEIYARCLMSALDAREKRLFLGSGVLLRNQFMSLPTDALLKANGKDFPAVMACGGLIHTLTIQEPWKQYTGEAIIFDGY